MGSAIVNRATIKCLTLHGERCGAASVIVSIKRSPVVLYLGDLDQAGGLVFRKNPEKLHMGRFVVFFQPRRKFIR